MTKVVVSSGKAPKALSFYSQAILTAHKYTLELAGQIGMDPASSKLVTGGVGTQTKQVFANIEGILSEVGWTLANVTKTRVYLTSMDDYQEMNEVYAKKHAKNPPARVAVAVKELPLGALVEIECVATGNTLPKAWQKST